MNYELRHFDTPLLRFSADTNSASGDIDVTWINKDHENLLPIGLSATNEGIASWIRHRAIPKNRAFVSTFLARNGLTSNRPLGIIDICRGLSLNDCYWVVHEGSEATFAKVNLYDNPMSRILAQIAFTGYGSNIHSEFASSPEFTTNGMLPKCWRRISGTIYLYKGGTSGFANAGFEPYSEYYATDIAKQLGIAHVDYELHKWKQTLCSSCKLFTSKELSFVPVASVVKTGGFAAVEECYRDMGEEYRQAFSDMLAFDALICNTDRHLNNFGFLADSTTNKIVSAAPLFDHGNALCHQAYGDDWTSITSLETYANAQDACMYDDFFETAKANMTRETRAKVRKALDFSFERKPAKGFPKKRLELLQTLIRKRAARLIK